MSPALIIYLIELMGNVGLIIGIIFGVFAVALILLIITVLENDIELSADNKKSLEFNKMASVATRGLIVSLVLYTIIPSKNSMYLMASANYLNKSDMPHKVLEVLNSKLDQMISTKTEGK